MNLLLIVYRLSSIYRLLMTLAASHQYQYSDFVLECVTLPVVSIPSSVTLKTYAPCQMELLYLYWLSFVLSVTSVIGSTRRFFSLLNRKALWSYSTGLSLPLSPITTLSTSWGSLTSVTSNSAIFIPVVVTPPKSPSVVSLPTPIIWFSS